MKEQLVLLVGADGWFYEDSPELLDELGHAEFDFNASLFAIANRGFVRLAAHDGLLEITLHASNVEERTLQTVQRLLLASSAERFRICHANGGWHDETLTSARETSVLLFDLCAAAAIGGAFDELYAEARC